ncbi:MAG: chromate resistance protein [Chloroflexi bacterium]|nr:chromate resistance protein [Chloroflexota bacterium]
MRWVVLSYSLPSKSSSSPRVALWRRLRRLGAITPTGGVHILPERDECVEAFQWLAQEIRQAQGEALVMRVEQFEGVTDAQLIELFREARHEEYSELEAQAAVLEQAIQTTTNVENLSEMQETLSKLRRRHADIARIDYFDCPTGLRVAAKLAAIQQALFTSESSIQNVTPAVVAEYQDRRWVTRPRPHVDRLACAWLIRRFINPKALIRYALQPEPDEIAFDMSEAQFGHQGNLCTFETMMLAFNLDDPGLCAIAEIVHEIDLRDGQYTRPETIGVDVILKGWLLAGLTDAELEAHGIALFEGLYVTLSHTSSHPATY